MFCLVRVQSIAIFKYDFANLKDSEIVLIVKVDQKYWNGLAKFRSLSAFFRKLEEFKSSYYMANSVSGQDEPIARCDWLPERARWSYLARSELPAVSRNKDSPKDI